MDEGVEYRVVEGFPDYIVGKDGSVWSCRKRGAASNDGNKRGGWHRLNGTPASRSAPYTRVRLSRRGKARLVAVNILVLEAFVGPRPNGRQACHRNGDCRDNRLDNLYWGTPLENARDRERHGRTAKGDRQGRYRTMFLLPEVWRLLRDGRSPQEIADRLGLTTPTIVKIREGRTWKNYRPDDFGTAALPRGRQVPVGEKSGRAKIKESDVSKIFRLRRRGLTISQIAGFFHIGARTVVDVLQRRTWKHVPIDSAILGIGRD